MANLTGGTANDTIVGADKIGDIINGAAGSDLLFGYGSPGGIVGGTPPLILADGGGAGDHDRIAGGLGDDTAWAGGGNDTVDGGDGADELDGGIGNDSLAGGVGVDWLDGSNGKDTLDGGAGADTMLGGDHDDLYIVDHALDEASEAFADALGGLDTVLSSVGYALLFGIENLTLAGAAASSGTGNGLNNSILGNAAANLLDGLDGHDTLNGGAGADKMLGGKGDDVFVLDNVADTAIELAGGGNDTIRWSLASALDLGAFAEIENATLLGAAAVNLTGTSVNNKLEGNSGANRIDGAGGADTMIGGAGNDTYVGDGGDTIMEFAGGGTDLLVSSVDALVLAANLENLTLIGAAVSGIGNGLKNVVTGNAGNNTLNGGADGGDTMIGGAGDDFYYVDAGDIVTESLAGGSDTVLWRGAGAYTLGANVENLALFGGGTGIGNALSNKIIGTHFDDILDGKAGADELVGDFGNDIYVFDNAGDTATGEGLGSGIDEIRSSVALAAAVAWVENYVFTSAAPVNFTGNERANKVTGTAGNDTIQGDPFFVDSDDTLIGGAGADRMAGGNGEDVYVVDNAKDVVDESLVPGGFVSPDTVQSSISFSLVSNGTTLLGEVEHLELLGTATINGTGNGLFNFINGNSGANKLSGLGGADTLLGGGGNDTLDGGSSDGAGDDLRGDAGNDLYFVEAGDFPFEFLPGPAGGIDTVVSTVDFNLSDFNPIENITLIGTAIAGSGNDIANVITGNDQANLIDGELGADKMIGGKGDDTYFVDNAGDIVTETAGGGGRDAVRSSIDYTLPAEVENLLIFGAGSKGTGNALANILTGGNGDDTLDGKAGADIMNGGFGDDLLFVDNVADVTFDEVADTDEVRSSVSYTISLGIEVLTLIGTAAINGTGNAVPNRIAGNSGANALVGDAGDDILIGGAGNDTLDGGAGSDDFVFGPAPGKDSISGFSFTDTGTGLDQIDIRDLLVGFVAGVSNPLDFVQISVGEDATILKVDANGLVGGSSFTDVAIIAAPPPDGITIDDIVANNLILT